MQPTRLSLTSLLVLALLSATSTWTLAQETAPVASTPSDSNSGDSNSGSAVPAPVKAGDGWPCEQRLQPELSIGAIWSGPDPTAAADEWRQDNAVQVLVSQVAPRRLPQDQAVAAIHRFAAGYGKDRTVTMIRVFAGLFETMNQERGQIIRGIRHFNERQQKLADRIQIGTKALDGLDPNSTDQSVAEQRAALEQAVAWDSRIFDDRERLLPVVCGVPVTIERRLFALSRAVSAEIDVKN
jgi:hypothetical protein